jgi:hypothetical protein
VADLKRRIGIKGKYSAVHRGQGNASPLANSAAAKSLRPETTDKKRRKDLPSSTRPRKNTVHSPISGLDEPAPGSEIAPSDEGEQNTPIPEEVRPEFLDGVAGAETEQPNNALDADIQRDASSLDDVVGGEKTATIADGQDSATNEVEDNFVTSSKLENLKKSSIKASFRSRKAKVGALIAAVSVTISIVGAIAFLPNFVMRQMTEKITDAFMDTSAYALKKRTEVYIRKYVTNVVGPAYNQCGTKVARDCQNFNPTDSIAGRLYTSWRNNRIEQRIFDKYGLEFELDERDPNRIRVFKTNANGVRGEIDTFGRNSVTNEVVRLIRNETEADGVFKRRHVRSILSTKYNARKFCFIACSTRDDIDNFRFSAVQKLKLKLIGRVVEPVSSKLSTYMICFTLNCGDIEGQASRAAQEVIERSDRELLERVAREIEESGARNLTEFAARRVGSALMDALLKRGVSQAGAQATSKAISGAVPVVGWIYTGVSLADLFDRIDVALDTGQLSKYLRSVNEEAYANYASTMLSAADDTQSYQASLIDSGALFSLVNGFGESRLSQSISDVSPKSTVTCGNGTILTGENDPLVCPERNVQQPLFIEELRQDPLIDTMFAIGNSYGRCMGKEISGTCFGIRPRTFLRPLLNSVNWVLGQASDLIFSAASSLPGVGELMSFATNFAQENITPIIEALSQKLFPTVVDATLEDAGVFEQTAGGVDVINSNLIRGYEDEDGRMVGMGGQRLTVEESRVLRQKIAEEKNNELRSRSFFARYLDFNETGSLVSNATLAFASQLEYPFTVPSIAPSGESYFSTIASILGGTKRASALSAIERESIFGVTQYGFRVDDPLLEVDPDTLTPEACALYAAARLESQYVNEETGQVEYAVMDPCMLDAVVVDTLIKRFELDAIGTTTSAMGNFAGGSTGLPTSFIAGQRVDPATLNLRAPCPSSPTIQQLGLETGAYFAGQQYTIMMCAVHGVRINTAYATVYDNMFNDMATAGYTINGSAGFRSASAQQAGFANGQGSNTFAAPGRSYHQFAIAVDIACQGGGQSYAPSGSHRGRSGFIENIRQYPCLNWVAENSQRYGLLLQCIGESTRAGGGEIRRDDGGCEWWHISPTGA